MINHKPPKVCWTDTTQIEQNIHLYKYPEEDLKLANTHGIRTVYMYICMYLYVYGFYYEFERNNM